MVYFFKNMLICRIQQSNPKVTWCHVKYILYINHGKYIILLMAPEGN